MRRGMTMAAGMVIAAGFLAGAGGDVVGEEAGRKPARLSIPSSRFPTSREADQARAEGSGASSWWLLGLGVVLAGAGWAGVSLAGKRGASGKKKGPGVALEVVGRVSVGPRQGVCLVRVNEQVLILGTGPQGPPALLGELTEPARAGEEAR